MDMLSRFLFAFTFILITSIPYMLTHNHIARKCKKKYGVYKYKSGMGKNPLAINASIFMIVVLVIVFVCAFVI